MQQTTLFERMGGLAFFEELVERFYEGVESDPVMRAMYPDDLEPGKAALALFFAQYWGGPGTYSEVRGHPRLRMRHAPFQIGERERDSWLAHMSSALDALDVPAAERQEFDTYFVMAAEHMVNH